MLTDDIGIVDDLIDDKASYQMERGAWSRIKAALTKVENASANTDYTAALEEELIRIFALETYSFIRNNLGLVAKRLNAAIRKVYSQGA